MKIRNEPGGGRRRPDVRIDRPAGPVRAAEQHAADRRLRAEQEAINDQGCGGYDELYLVQIDGRLPYERHIDAETARLRSDARGRATESGLIARSLVAQLTGRGIAGRGVRVLEGAVGHLSGQLSELRERRRGHVEVLDGLREDGSGRNRTGPVPITHRPWLWWLHAHGLTILIGLMELIALHAVLAYVLGVDNPNDWLAHPEVTATALIGAIVMLATPLALGVMLRGPKRNRQPRPLHTVGQTFLFVVMLGAWLGVDALLAVARAAAFAAPTTTGLGEQGAGGIDYTMAVLLFAVFGLLGFFSLWHEARHNWHQDVVVALNQQERRLRRKLAEAESELAATEAQLSVQQDVVATEPVLWTEHIDVTLPALAEELTAAYRCELIRRMADPVLTGALGTVGGSAEPSTAPTEATAAQAPGDSRRSTESRVPA